MDHCFGKLFCNQCLFLDRSCASPKIAAGSRLKQVHSGSGPVYAKTTFVIRVNLTITYPIPIRGPRPTQGKAEIR